MRRDDVEPAPWTAEGIERSKKLGLTLQVTPETHCELVFQFNKHTGLQNTLTSHIYVIQPTALFNEYMTYSITELRMYTEMHI